MKKDFQLGFCMTQFKPAIAGLAILLAVVLGWETWHCAMKRKDLNFVLTAGISPIAPSIKVKDKMLHGYWGNCSKCHMTTDAGAPISKVMAGPPISIKQKMTHKYWGNCLLCHKVTDGVQPQNLQNKPVMAAAFKNSLTAESIGLKIQAVTGALMRKFSLANEDGALIIDVYSNSVSSQAGLKQGDEIIRIDKARIETQADFETALSKIKPGANVKVNIYRGKKNLNVHLKIPRDIIQNLAQAAVTIPLIQDNMWDNNEILNEQIIAPAPQQNQNAGVSTQNQRNFIPAGINIYYGKVAIAATGPNLNYQISNQFELSPYFIIFDPANSSFSAVVNPNINRAMGRDIQTAQYMVDLGVSSVIAGSFSSSAIGSLHILRMNVYSGISGPIQNVVNAYVSGQLIPLNTSSVPTASVPQVYPSFPYSNAINQSIIGNIGQSMIF